MLISGLKKKQNLLSKKRRRKQNLARCLKSFLLVTTCLQVSIISQILALASCTSEPMDPFFPKDTVVLAVQTVVDGFLEM